MFHISIYCGNYNSFNLSPVTKMSLLDNKYASKNLFTTLNTEIPHLSDLIPTYDFDESKEYPDESNAQLIDLYMSIHPERA